MSRENGGRSARTAIPEKALPRVQPTTFRKNDKNPNHGLVNTSVYDEAWNYDRKGIALAFLSRRSEFHSPHSSARTGNCPWTPRQAGEAARQLDRWPRVLIVSCDQRGYSNAGNEPRWGIVDVRGKTCSRTRRTLEKKIKNHAFPRPADKKRRVNENEKSEPSGQCGIFLSVCQCTEVRLGLGSPR